MFIREDLYPAGTPFETDPEHAAFLLDGGYARHARPPEVLYETESPEQNDARLREQGVSCVCLTRNRRDWLPQAIASYIAQSYTPRELLIIGDGADVCDLVPQRPDIRLIQIEEGRNIGDKRNFGASLARGRYIAHWDDDDYSAPDRLLDQVDRLKASGLAVTGYSQVDFTDGARWWRHTADDGFAGGSSLLYERAWWEQHQFPFIQIAEDAAFVETARIRGQIITAKSNGMLTATIHPGNTSPRNLDARWEQLPESGGLSVIIPSKTVENAIPCMTEVRRHELDAKIIIVDDGMRPDDSFPSYGFVIPGEKPFIFSRNVNIGIRAAGRDDVLILNDDAILKTPGGFSVLQKAAQENPELGVIAATTNVVGNSNQRNMGIGLREDPRMVCFVAVLIPRTTLDRIGYLDERFNCYSHQDDDYCYRVKMAGLKIGIHDGCYVDHGSLVSSFRGPGGRAELETGRRIFHEKWGVWPV